MSKWIQAFRTALAIIVLVLVLLIWTKEAIEFGAIMMRQQIAAGKVLDT